MTKEDYKAWMVIGHYITAVEKFEGTETCQKRF